MFKRKNKEQEVMEVEQAAVEGKSPLDEWDDSLQEDLGEKQKKRFFFWKKKD